MINRQLVFISHANPEDNEFASWLGMRLSTIGYDVWADIVQLVGGEPIWRNIGEAIKEHAAIVIVVLSHSSYQKDGVLDEIAVAVATGRKLQSSSFVLPIRLDNLSFDEFPEQLIRRTAVDFSNNWADGLSQIVEALQKCRIPHRDTDMRTALDTWRKFRLRQTATMVAKPEIVLSNWFSIAARPRQIIFSRFNSPQDTMSKALQEFRSPTVPYGRLVGSFADTTTLRNETLSTSELEHAYSIPLNEIIYGAVKCGPGLNRRDGQNMVTNLMRQGWNSFAEQRGLIKYQFSYDCAWFLPLDLIEKNIGQFTDHNGKVRRRLLVGRSEKRGVYWHLAMNAKFMLNEPTRIMMRPHVVFTTDGKTPLESKAKTARLRRSFCKMWWNDRWRDLVRAFVFALADEKESLHLPLGGDTYATVISTPMVFSAPVSLPNDAAASPAIEDITEETEADALDDLEDIFPDEATIFDRNDDENSSA